MPVEGKVNSATEPMDRELTPQTGFTPMPQGSWNQPAPVVPVSQSGAVVAEPFIPAPPEEVDTRRAGGLVRADLRHSA